jgi:hypothetical protein
MDASECLIRWLVNAVRAGRNAIHSTFRKLFEAVTVASPCGVQWQEEGWTVGWRLPAVVSTIRSYLVRVVVSVVKN